VEENPHQISVARQTEYQSSVGRILRANKFHPYHIFFQELNHFRDQDPVRSLPHAEVEDPIHLGADLQAVFNVVSHSGHKIHFTVNCQTKIAPI
jgi:hypothetical protein